MLLIKEEAVKIAAYKKQLKEENEFLQLRLTNMELQIKLFHASNTMNKMNEKQKGFEQIKAKAEQYDQYLAKQKYRDWETDRKSVV